MDVRLYLIVVLICIFLIISGVEHPSESLLSICISSLEKYLFKDLVRIWISLFFIVEFKEFSVYSDSNPYQMYDRRNSLPSVFWC